MVREPVDLSVVDREVMAMLRSCPDVHVDLANGDIKILKAVRFEKKKYRLIGDSELILIQVAECCKAVATVLKTHEMAPAKFEVGGHTNAAEANRGNKFQMTLSEDRAAACMKFLLAKGVDESMLEAKGYGGTQRKYEGSTEEMALNQRVEFQLQNFDELSSSRTTSPTTSRTTSPTPRAANSGRVVETRIDSRSKSDRPTSTFGGFDGDSDDDDLDI